MMKEKKVKDHMRGYVGAPIQHHRLENYSEDENLPTGLKKNVTQSLMTRYLKVRASLGKVVL